jgi:hypothetical protein
MGRFVAHALPVKSAKDEMLHSRESCANGRDTGLRVRSPGPADLSWEKARVKQRPAYKGGSPGDGKQEIIHGAQRLSTFNT